MRTIFTLLFALVCSIAIAGNKTLDKLATVNKFWLQQNDIHSEQLPPYTNMDEQLWIRLHLQLVETTLRARPTNNLTLVQRQNRTSALNHLHAYWQSGAFPINEDYNYRTPIFIDKHDNFCAVGYLVKATGFESVSRMIAAKTNLAYVMDMHYPELDTWAEQYGFTKDELAWIQPGYPPQNTTESIGKGVDGSVSELYTDNDTLYVGGLFTNVDSSILANNIAYVTEAAGVYTWHSMSTGVNGEVKAIHRYKGQIYIAGHFDKAGDSTVQNMARWADSIWQPIGCIYGTVNDLVSYHGSLYAAGSFDVCAAMTDVNLARLDTVYNIWQPISGLSGHINTMEVKDDILYLGGKFSYRNDTVNVMRLTDTGFAPLIFNTEMEVMDFTTYNDTLLLVGKAIPGRDSVHLYTRIVDDYVDTTFYTTSNSSSIYNWQYPLLFNTIEKTSQGVSVGGYFTHYVMQFAQNVAGMTPYYYGIGQRDCGGPSFWVDSTVNKLIMYKGNLIAGGNFKTGNIGVGFSKHRVNGICKEFIRYGNVNEQSNAHNLLITYPNPLNGTRILNIENQFHAAQFHVIGIDGRILQTGKLNKQQSKQSINIADNLATGTYIIQVANEQGEKASKMIVVK